MWHLFPGFSGGLTSVFVAILIWIVRRRAKENALYNLGPGGNTPAYEPLLTRYIRLAEFMVGLATGSIVLIVGSSALHGQGGRLPWFYASPLILIASSVVYGLGFMAAQLVTMEEALHGNDHTAAIYTLNEMFGYSALICFVIGYLWLIFAVTNMGA